LVGEIALLNLAIEAIDLNRERRQLLEQREENQELVKFAEEQRSLVSEQRDRQNAPEFLVLLALFN
jgi:hypothetical protein